MPVLKLPIVPKLPTKPRLMPGGSMDDRVKQLEQYANEIQKWATALSRSYTSFTKELTDLFNRGSVKRL